MQSYIDTLPTSIKEIVLKARRGSIETLHPTYTTDMVRAIVKRMDHLDTVGFYSECATIRSQQVKVAELEKKYEMSPTADQVQKSLQEQPLTSVQETIHILQARYSK